MAMARSIRRSNAARRACELQLWREANTIFMGPSGGHGGCGALGLALARASPRLQGGGACEPQGRAARRPRASPSERVEVMRVLQERDLAEARAAGIPDPLSTASSLAEHRGRAPRRLRCRSCSTARATSTATATAALVRGDRLSTTSNVYVNDPWVVARQAARAPRDMTDVPIPRRAFERMTALRQEDANGPSCWCGR